LDNNATVKFIRNDGATFTISRNSDWRFKTKGLDNFGEFTTDLNYIDNATSDGGIITSARMTKVDRTLECAYIVPTNNDNARKVATGFFNASSTYKVYVTYAGRTRWAEGRLLKLSMPTTADISKLLTMALTIEFPNPYWKSEDPFGEDIASVMPTTAFPYMSANNVKPYGHPTGRYNFAKTVVLNNDGDVEAYCTAIFNANGTVVNPKLIINDQYVRVLDTLVDGDELTMDFTANPPTIRKNGVNYIGHCDRTSAFDSMILAIGDTAIQYDSDDGSDNLAVYVYYNKLYCSL